VGMRYGTFDEVVERVVTRWRAGGASARRGVGLRSPGAEFHDGLEWPKLWIRASNQSIPALHRLTMRPRGRPGDATLWHA